MLKMCIVLMLPLFLLIEGCTSTNSTVAIVKLQTKHIQTSHIKLIKYPKKWVVKGNLHALGNDFYSNKQVKIDFLDINGQLIKSYTAKLKELSSQDGVHKRHTCSMVRFSITIAALPHYDKVRATLTPMVQE